MCISYLKIYNYFKMIETKLLAEYLSMRQDEEFYEKHERIIHENFRKEFEGIQCFNPDKSLATTDEASWSKLKRTIYWNLSTHINNEFELYANSEKNPESQDLMFPALIGKVKSISEVLRTFP